MAHQVKGARHAFSIKRQQTNLTERLAYQNEDVNYMLDKQEFSEASKYKRKKNTKNNIPQFVHLQSPRSSSSREREMGQGRKGVLFTASSCRTPESDYFGYTRLSQQPDWMDWTTLEWPRRAQFRRHVVFHSRAS